MGWCCVKGPCDTSFCHKAPIRAVAMATDRIKAKAIGEKRETQLAAKMSAYVCTYICTYVYVKLTNTLFSQTSLHIAYLNSVITQIMAFPEERI